MDASAATMIASMMPSKTDEKIEPPPLILEEPESRLNNDSRASEI